MISLSSYSNPDSSLAHFASKLYCPPAAVVPLCLTYFDMKSGALLIQTIIRSRQLCARSLYTPSDYDLK